MESASLIISLFAVAISLAIAGYGFWFQLSTYHATTKDLGDFRSEITAVEAEIRGKVTALESLQGSQFSQMLEAFVRDPRRLAEAAGGAERSVEAFSDIERQLQNLSEQLETFGSRLDEVGGPQFESLRRDLKQVEEQARRGLEAASDVRDVTSWSDRYLQAKSLLLRELTEQAASVRLSPHDAKRLRDMIIRHEAIPLNEFTPEAVSKIHRMGALRIANFDGYDFVTSAGWTDTGTFAAMLQGYPETAEAE